MRLKHALIGFSSMLALVGARACKVDESALDRIFSCDLSSGDRQCGRDENDRPMKCYAGSAQLGGKAFCVKSCNPAASSDDAGFECVSSGALLKRCSPRAGDEDCPSPLHCYRTNVLKDEGLCLWVPICPYAGDAGELDDTQCPYTHPNCAGAELAKLAPGLLTNNLHCVAEPPCDARGCPTDPVVEICPREYYSTGFDLPLLCTVPCDESSCPPNFACAQGPASVCLPGVPGMRCRNDEDCLAGDCLDTGAGFSECVVQPPCASDADCTLPGVTVPFLCAEGVPGAGAHCVSFIAFGGSNCDSASDCHATPQCGAEACPAQRCFTEHVNDKSATSGECRFPCDSNGRCPAFGGVPHICLGPNGGCYPGTFGMPCQGDSEPECVANLSCETIPPDDRNPAPTTVCTAPCDTKNGDEDCKVSASLWLNGYCVPDTSGGTTGHCQLLANQGLPCERDTQCKSGRCSPEDGSEARVCAPE